VKKERNRIRKAPHYQESKSKYSPSTDNTIISQIMKRKIKIPILILMLDLNRA
jgi:hypothetical protein